MRTPGPVRHIVEMVYILICTSDCCAPVQVWHHLFLTLKITNCAAGGTWAMRMRCILVKESIDPRLTSSSLFSGITW